MNEQKQSNDGGPAYPVTTATQCFSDGMSLRDHYVGLAMLAIRTEPSQFLECKSIAATNGSGDVEGVVAHFAGLQADRLVALKEHPTSGVIANSTHPVSKGVEEAENAIVDELLKALDVLANHARTLSGHRVTADRTAAQWSRLHAAIDKADAAIARATKQEGGAR